ncbi:hypothetical protein F5Y08DRAFT_302893 [Xylaria arbuscula]|nr:hypothetical protein F5Y08DRAFT_302893 [Xylaria arbuscula]
MANVIPRVSASLSLHPTTYSVSSDEPPHLNLTVTSHHNAAITIFADDLSPRLITHTGCALTITDLADGTVVKQTMRTHCRIPLPKRFAVPLDESQFHTLYPSQSLTFSAQFTNGVDSLVPGHKYMIAVSRSQRLQWYRVRWWDFGTKEEVLAKGLDGRQVRYGKGPQEPIDIEITGILEMTMYLEPKY